MHSIWLYLLREPVLPNDVDSSCEEEVNPEVEQQEPQPSTSASAANAEKVVANIRRAQAGQKRNYDKRNTTNEVRHVL